MTHDPMCPNNSASCCPWMGDCNCDCQCNFIVRVREDERKYGMVPGFDLGYAAALRDAVEAARAALPINIAPSIPGFDPTERKAYQIGARYGAAKVIAAIEALGGER